MSHSKPPDTLDFYLAHICHMHYMRIHQLLEALGLYRGQPGILHALWEQEGLTQTELAANLRNTPATVTRMLQRMEKAGFVYRTPDPSDQRVTRVYLTEAGRAVKADVENVWQTMDQETFAGLSPDERSTLRLFFLRISMNLEQAIGEPGMSLSQKDSQEILP
jgi:DNA-binding MarR family transcriptional regulator